MLPPKETIKSWEYFGELVSRWDASSSMLPVVFRGHADASWSLTHTLYRALTLDGQIPPPSKDEALRKERESVKGFEVLARPYLPIAVSETTKSSSEWWTVMQHYGAPTRLIDWTSSPYIAAYFSVSSYPNCDGSLYRLDGDSLKNLMENRYGKDWDMPNPPFRPRVEAYFRDGRPSVSLIYRKDQTDRIANQESYFTVCGDILMNHEDALYDPNFNVLTRYLIPSGLKKDFLHRLKIMNISAATLFPGIDGLGRSINEFIRMTAG